MDENLMNSISEDAIEEMDLPVEDVESDIPTEEITHDIVVEPEEDVVIDISESMGWVSGDDRYHDSLLGVDSPRQHPIEAITNLREELDEIEALKTVYSDKPNIANYYEWKDAAYNDYGYFVSLVPNTSKIEIYNGFDIFGVSVDVAGFVGGQDADIPRDNSYGLIVTSGLVDVRCELDIEVGDYVTANAYGYAKKAESNYGYKVLAKENKHGVEYAVIALGVQADMTNTLGAELDAVEKRVSVNEQNIVSAINVSNQAYNKAESAATSASISKEAVEEALKDVLGFGDTLDEMEKTVTSSSIVSAQAKAIAESAVTSAASMRTEAVETANKAWTNTNNLIETLKPITEWEKDGISGADYLATQMDNGIATIYDVKVVDDKLEVAQSAIIRNGKELQSLMTVIDKYSVGPYSQAYGFTLEQAASVLEEGMIYVPTESVTEKYEYTENGAVKEYKRDFTRGYLYRWGKPDGYPCGWITVDKDYSKDKLNTSAPAVHFATEPPSVSGDFGYWYTNGDTVSEGYDSYTLYKWEKPEDEEGYWFAVATLAGNSQSRATSQIRQDANSIELRVTNTEGSAAASKQWIDDNSANIQDVVAWKGKNADSIATFMSTASDNFASTSQVAKIVDKDGNINAASIVTAVTEDDSSISLLANNITLDASQITLNGEATFVTEDSEDGTTKINGANIATGTITANKINTDQLSAISANLGTVEAGVLKSQGYGTPIVWDESSELNELNYSLNDDDTYTVTGLKKFINPNLIIPSTYNGKPVTAIGREAFRNQKAFKSLVIKNNITIIGDYAFTDCTGLINMTISDSVTRICSYAFWGCTNLVHVELPNNLQKIGESAFNTCSSLESIVIPTSIVGEKNDYTKGITVYAFYNCPSLKKVYYKGDSTSWDNILIGNEYNGSPTNQALLDATRYYYSETKPTDTENKYWYYNDSGFKISCDDDNMIDSKYFKVSQNGHATMSSGHIGGWDLSTYALEHKPGSYIYSTDGIEHQYGGFGMRVAHPGIRTDRDPLLAVGWGENIGNGKDWANSPFCVFADGKMKTSKGYIGNLQIKDGIRGYSESGEQYLALTSQKLQIGNTTLGYDLDNDIVLLSANGRFKIQGDANNENSASMSFMTGEDNIERSITISCYVTNTKITDDSYTVYYKLTADKNLIYSYTDTIYCIIGPEYALTDELWVNEHTFIINPGSTTSDEYSVTYKTSNNDSDGPSDGDADIYIKFSHTENGAVSSLTKKYLVQNIQVNSWVLRTTVRQIEPNNNIYISGHFVPSIEGCRLGTDTRPWTNIYATTLQEEIAYTASGTVGVSDRNKKNTISTLSPNYESVFDQLRPVTFKYNDGTSDRLHTGFIAQEVKDSVIASGLTTQDFAGYCEWTDDSGVETCGLRYSEFIALCVDQIQKLKLRVEELEEKLKQPEVLDQPEEQEEQID